MSIFNVSRLCDTLFESSIESNVNGVFWLDVGGGVIGRVYISVSGLLWVSKVRLVLVTRPRTDPRFNVAVSVLCGLKVYKHLLAPDKTANIV